MYLKYYRLRDLPFSLTPDPRFLYFTSSHREVMANLQYGLEQGKGLIVVTGEVGTGKTTLIRAILSTLDKSVTTSYVFNPGLTVSEFYEQLAADFRLGPVGSRAELLRKLGDKLSKRHARKLNTVLIVDEAQGLPRDLLEEIRLLLNFETHTEKQLQVVMVGQPELRRVLNSPDLRQLKQRISLRSEVRPLRADEVQAYIESRLQVAGAKRLDIFTPEAVGLIYRLSEGIPRMVNNICDNALLTGYALDSAEVTEEIVNEVAEALDLVSSSTEAII